MAGFKIRVNARVVTRKFQRAARNAERMTEAWNEVGEIVVDSVQDNFDAGGRPTRWKPWSDGYAERMARKGKGGNKVLIDNGTLRNSITYAASSRGVEIGTVEEYARRHQLGGGGTPARPFLLLQDQDSDAIEETLLEHLTGPLR